MRSRSGKDPLFELISFRYDFSLSYKENDGSPEYSCICLVPTFDKQQFSKFADEVKQNKSVEAVLKQLGYNFPFDVDELRAVLKNKDRFKQHIQLYTTVIGLYAMGFVSDRNNILSVEKLELVMDLLNRINNTEYTRIVNYLFKKVVTLALYNKEMGFKWVPAIIQPIIVQFYTNVSLESDFFKILIDFLDQVSQTEHVDSVRDTKLMFEQIVIDSRPIIHTDDITPALNYLDKFIVQLESISMRILCRITKLFRSRAVLEEIFKIPTIFAEKVVNSITNPLLPEHISNTKFVTSEKMQPYSSIVIKNDLSPYFMQPPYERLHYGAPLKDFIPRQIYSMAVDLGESLSLGSSEAFESVLQSLITSVCISTDPNQSVYIYSAFFVIYKKVTDLNLIKLLIPTIMNTFVMNPANTIFGDAPLHDLINSLRTSFIDFLIERDIEVLPDVIEMCERTPIFFTEICVRIMQYETMDYTRFTSTKMLKCFGQSLVDLCQCNYKNLEEPRSALLSFIFKIFESKELAKKCFTCNLFIPFFMSLSLETDLTQTIFFAVRNILPFFDPTQKSYILEPLVNWYCDAIEGVIPKANDDQYLHYLQVMVTTLSDAIAEQTFLSLSFQPILNLLLDFIDVRPDSLILENVLKILSGIERSMDRFMLERAFFARLVKAIKKVDNDEPSDKIFSLLMSLLSGYCAMTTLTRFYIKEPSIVPLIIAVFGKSQKFVEILKTFMSLCNYTSYNCRQFHDGDLDWILMTYIFQRKDNATFYYRNVEISINLTYNDVQKHVLPLLSTISFTKSSNAIATSMVNFISKNVDERSFDFANFLEILLGKCATTPLSIFSLCTSAEPQFSVQNIFASDLNQGFSVTFKVNVDATPFTSSNASMSIFSITDYDENLLRCFLSAGHMFLKYEADCTRTSVILAKNIPSQQWTVYTVIIKMDNGMVRISTYQNSEPLNDSDLVDFTFNGKLDIDVGGLNEPMADSQWDNIQMGAFGDFAIYTEILTRQDVEELNTRPWAFSKTPIFRSRSIPKPGVLSTITIPRKRVSDPSSLFGSSVESIIINVPDCRVPSLNLLDNMIDGQYGNILANFFNCNCTDNNYPPMIFGLIKLIFKRSIVTQKGFSSIGIILTNLMQHDYILNSDLYMSVYNVLDSIEYSPLYKDWFNKLVFNFWLWIRAPPQDLQFILTHWYTILLPNTTSMLKKKAYFSLLLSQFKLVLSFSKEDDDIKSVNDLTSKMNIKTSNFFSSKYTVEYAFKIREMFVKIMKRLAFIHFTSQDFIILFTHLTSCKTRTNTIIFLKLIQEITKPLLTLNLIEHRYIGLIESLVKDKDFEIVKNTIITINMIGYNNISEYSYQIYLDLSEENKKKVFEYFSENLMQFPGLMTLLCLIAIHFGSQYMELFAPKISLSLKSDKLFYCPDWFVWPLIMAYNIHEDHANFIILYICQVIPKMAKPVVEFYKVYYFIRFLYDVLSPPTSKLLIMFIKTSFYTVMSANNELDSAVVYATFSSFFFHSCFRSHNEALIAEMVKSPFNDPDFMPYSTKSILMLELSNLEHLEKLSKIDPNNILLYYEARTNKECKFLDMMFVEEAMICSNTYDLFKHDSKYLIPMMSITKNQNLPNESRQQFMANSLYFFEKSLADHQHNYRDVVSSILEQLRVTLESQEDFHKYINDRFRQSYAMESNDIIANEFEISLQDMCNLIPNKQTYTRDRTYCYAFCPFKKKILNQEKQVKQFLPLPDAIQAFKVNLVSEKISSPADFRIYRDRAFIITQVTSKELMFDMIGYLFTRPNYLEIYMNDGRSYLMNFPISDTQTLLKFFPKNMLPGFKFISPPPKQKDFFLNLPFTHLWLNQVITTFEYIMYMNIFSGRSFNSPDMQPIFPPLLSDININGCIFDFSKVVECNDDIAIDSLCKKKNVNARIYFDSTVPGTVPSWAKDRYEFIATIRKMLDTPSIQKIVLSWIDYNFGCNMKKQKHKQLFLKSHPPKNSIAAPLTKMIRRQLSTQTSRIVFAAINTDLNDFHHKYTLGFVLSNGTYSSFSCGIFDQDIKISSHMANETIDITPNTSFAYNQCGCVIYTPEKKTAVVYKDSKLIGTFTLFCETNIFVYCENSFIFCPDFCTISIVEEYKKDAKPSVLTLSSCKISALCASPRFRVFAYGTIDGNISVHALNRHGTFVNRANIQGEPEFLIITRNYGYIVAATSTKIIVMTINGEIIREAEMNRQIQGLYAFEHLGQDLIAYVTSDHQISYFHALYPDKSTTFYETKENIQAITYNMGCESFIIVSTDSIRFIPFPNLM